MYIPSTRKIILSYYVVLDKRFYSTLEYTSQPYVEVMDMHRNDSYTTYVISLISTKEVMDNLDMF